MSKLTDLQKKLEEINALLSEAIMEDDAQNNTIHDYTDALCTVKKEKEGLRGKLTDAVDSAGKIDGAVDKLDLNCDPKQPQQSVMRRR